MIKYLLIAFLITIGCSQHTCLIDSQVNITQLVPTDSEKYPICSGVPSIDYCLGQDESEVQCSVQSNLSSTSTATTNCFSTSQRIRIKADYTNVPEKYLADYERYFSMINTTISENFFVMNFEPLTSYQLKFENLTTLPSDYETYLGPNGTLPDELFTGYNQDLVIICSENLLSNGTLMKSNIIATDPSTGRPTVALLAVDVDQIKNGLYPNYPKSSVFTPSIYGYIYQVLLHEFVHILGFQESLIPTWVNLTASEATGNFQKYDSELIFVQQSIFNDIYIENFENVFNRECDFTCINGQQYDLTFTEQIPVDTPFQTVVEWELQLYTSGNALELYEAVLSSNPDPNLCDVESLGNYTNQTHWLLATPNLLRYTQFYYNNSNLTGFPLEDYADVYGNKTSHLERTAVPYELMADFTPYVLTVQQLSFSYFSLNGLLDTGWYVPNPNFIGEEYDYQRNNSEFFNTVDDFCYLSDSEFCVTTCDDPNMNLFTPISFQPDCQTENTFEDIINIGSTSEFFGPESGLFETSVSTYNIDKFDPRQDLQSVCLKYECVDSNNTIIIYIGGNQILCGIESNGTFPVNPGVQQPWLVNGTHYEQVKLLGWQGFILCPSYQSYCPQLPVQCPNNCNGQGVCIFGKCQCYINSSGPDCQCYQSVWTTVNNVTECYVERPCLYSLTTDASYCIDCIFGYTLFENTCIQTLQGYYWSNSSETNMTIGSYQRCPAGCQSCGYNNTVLNCYQCFQGYYANVNDTITPCVQNCLDGQFTFYRHFGQVECLNQIPSNAYFYYLLDIYNIENKPFFSYQAGLPLEDSQKTFVPDYNSTLNPFCGESEIPINCVSQWNNVFPYGAKDSSDLLLTTNDDYPAFVFNTLYEYIPQNYSILPRGNYTYFVNVTDSETNITTTVQKSVELDILVPFCQNLWTIEILPYWPYDHISFCIKSCDYYYIIQDSEYSKQCFHTCPEGYFGQLGNLNGPNICVKACLTGQIVTYDILNGHICTQFSNVPDGLLSYTDSNGQQYALEQCYLGTYLSSDEQSCSSQCLAYEFALTATSKCYKQSQINFQISLFKKTKTLITGTTSDYFYLLSPTCPQDSEFYILLANNDCELQSDISEACTSSQLFVKSSFQCITATSCPPDTYLSKQVCYDECPAGTLYSESQQSCESSPQKEEYIVNYFEGDILQNYISADCPYGLYIYKDKENNLHCEDMCPDELFASVVISTTGRILQTPTPNSYSDDHLIIVDDIQQGIYNYTVIYDFSCVEQNECPNEFIAFKSITGNQCIFYDSYNPTSSSYCLGNRGWLNKEKTVCYDSGLCPDGYYGIWLNSTWNCVETCPDSQPYQIENFYNSMNTHFLAQHCSDSNFNYFQFSTNSTQYVQDCQLYGKINSFDQVGNPYQCIEALNECESYKIIQVDSSVVCGYCQFGSFYDSYNQRCVWSCVKPFQPYSVDGDLVCLESCPDYYYFYQSESYYNVCLENCPLISDDLLTCYDECPDGQEPYILDPTTSQLTCASQCPEESPFVTLNNGYKQCNIECPSTETYQLINSDNDDMECVEQISCPSGLFANIDSENLNQFSCDAECYSYYINADQTECVESCDQVKQVAENGFCIDNCGEGYYLFQLEDGNVECEQWCLDGLFASPVPDSTPEAFECVQACPDELPYVENGFCLNECTEDYKLYSVPNSTNSTLTYFECLLGCPQDLFQIADEFGNLFCTSDCSSTIYQYNITSLDFLPQICTSNCAQYGLQEYYYVDYQVYYCDEQCKEGYYNYTNTTGDTTIINCQQVCPTDLYTFESTTLNSCVTDCTQYDSTYTNIQNDGVLECSLANQCPLNTYLVETTQINTSDNVLICSSTCPDTAKIFEGQSCVSSCNSPNYLVVINSYQNCQAKDECPSNYPMQLVEDSNLNCQLYCSDFNTETKTYVKLGETFECIDESTCKNTIFKIIVSPTESYYVCQTQCEGTYDIQSFGIKNKKRYNKCSATCSLPTPWIFIDHNNQRVCRNKCETWDQYYIWTDGTKNCVYSCDSAALYTYRLDIPGLNYGGIQCSITPCPVGSLECQKLATPAL